MTVEQSNHSDIVHKYMHVNGRHFPDEYYNIDKELLFKYTLLLR
jgi:hypothetical protein